MKNKIITFKNIEKSVCFGGICYTVSAECNGIDYTATSPLYDHSDDTIIGFKGDFKDLVENIVTDVLKDLNIKHRDLSFTDKVQKVVILEESKFVEFVTAAKLNQLDVYKTCMGHYFS